MKKIFGMLLGAMIVLGLPVFADNPLTGKIDSWTDYEKTATPEDSVLVYGLVVMPYMQGPTKVLYTSSDLSKPNAPITHCFPSVLAPKQRIPGYYIFTGIVPKDTKYECIEWNLASTYQTGPKLLGHNTYTAKFVRGDFGETDLDFKSQDSAGLQFVGISYVVTKDWNAKDYATEETDKYITGYTLKCLQKMYKGSVWEPIIKEAMSAGNNSNETKKSKK